MTCYKHPNRNSLYKLWSSLFGVKKERLIIWITNSLSVGSMFQKP